MNNPEFEWDLAKAKRNQRLHRVTFDEAATVWEDEARVVADDDAHSASEQREITIGFSRRSRLLMVVFTKRHETTIRLISARRATPKEARRYAKRT